MSKSVTGPEADDRLGICFSETVSASGYRGFWHCPARREGVDPVSPRLTSVRLAQGLEATSFPLPAVSPQTFVALPVAWG